MSRKIDPTSAPTYRKYISEGGIHLPNLHEQTIDNVYCIVEGCNTLTNNSCKICDDCHPVQKVLDFPCAIVKEY